MDVLILKALNHFNDGKPSDLIKLKGDASSREYYRDQVNNLIICHYHADSDGFEHFKDMQKILEANQIKTPKILHSDFPILIQEDLGDISLHMNVTVDGYSKVISSLVSWQKLPTNFEYKKSEATFTKEKFMWELNFAVDHLNKILPKNEEFELQSEFSDICEQLLNSPQCPCHRDFHSKNLMLKGDDIYVIDFQDARMGPYLYDLVSLVEDPYVEFNNEYKQELKEEFLEFDSIKANNFESVYNATAIQRIFKACGSFAAQKNLKNTDEYLKYLNPALTNLSDLLTGTEYQKLKSYVDLNLKLWTNT